MKLFIYDFDCLLFKQFYKYGYKLSFLAHNSASKGILLSLLKIYNQWE